MLHGVTGQIEYVKWQSGLTEPTPDLSELSDVEIENLLNVEGGGFISSGYRLWIRSTTTPQAKASYEYQWPSPYGRAVYRLLFSTSEVWDAASKFRKSAQSGL
jgi:hypothetical protein